MQLKPLFVPLLLTTVLVGLGGISRTASAAVIGVHDRYDADHEPVALTLGAQFQYGVWTGDGDVNAYGPGLGLRAGVTLRPGLYVGGNFDYFAGESRESSAGSARVYVYDVVGEVGYDFWVYPHGVFRPKLGLGIGVAKVAACANVAGFGGCDSRSETGLAIAPGLQYLHFLGQAYLSLEVRYQTVSIDGSDPSAFILGGGLGLAF